MRVLVTGGAGYIGSHMVSVAERRRGDPAALVADATKARRVLGWQPVHTGIESIVRDAWEFEQSRGR